MRRAVVSPEMPAGAAARATIATHLATMVRELQGARGGKVESVHQLRVSMRRLRAALTLFASDLPKRTADVLERELQDLGRTVGSVRDLDVLAAALAKRGRKIDSRLEPAVATVLRHVREQRTAAHAVLATTLETPRTRRLIARLATIAKRGGGGEPAWKVAADLVRPLLRDVRRGGRGVGASSSARALHRLRIDAKRLRYALEALDGLGGDATRALAARLAELQDLLGDQRDATTQRAWLLDEVPSFVGDAEALVAIGAIAEALRRRGKRFARRISRAWRRVDHPKRIGTALEELERKPDAKGRAA
jgi:CHAD domain-containing protein